LRFDDTNTLKESEGFAQAIMNKVIGDEMHPLEDGGNELSPVARCTLPIGRQVSAWLDLVSRQYGRWVTGALHI